MQRERERQYNLVSQMMAMTVSPVQAMDSCHTQGTATAAVQQDMEVPTNPAYTQYMMERIMLEGNNCNPHIQDIKRHDPVYLTSMASHGVWQQQQIEHQQQHQLELQDQQQLELQQRSCQNQILAEQFGGFVTPNTRPDLIPLMESMQLE